jgi:hypothetical protein
MPCFKCSQCGCVQNTALCHYWIKVHLQKNPPLCSLCDPDIGKWHDQFPRRDTTGWKRDQDGYLWSQKEIDGGKLPGHVRIVGDA